MKPLEVSGVNVDIALIFSKACANNLSYELYSLITYAPISKADSDSLEEITMRSTAGGNEQRRIHHKLINGVAVTNKLLLLHIIQKHNQMRQTSELCIGVLCNQEKFNLGGSGGSDAAKYN